MWTGDNLEIMRGMSENIKQTGENEQQEMNRIRRAAAAENRSVL